MQNPTAADETGRRLPAPFSKTGQLRPEEQTRGHIDGWSASCPIDKLALICLSRVCHPGTVPGKSKSVSSGHYGLESARRPVRRPPTLEGLSLGTSHSLDETAYILFCCNASRRIRFSLNGDPHERIQRPPPPASTQPHPRMLSMPSQWRPPSVRDQPQGQQWAPPCRVRRGDSYRAASLRF